jgi:hypothetical protein
VNLRFFSILEVVASRDKVHGKLFSTLRKLPVLMAEFPRMFLDTPMQRIYWTVALMFA